MAERKIPICTTTVAISKESRRVLGILARLNKRTMQEYLYDIITEKAKVFNIPFDKEAWDLETYEEQAVLIRRQRIRRRMSKLGLKPDLPPIAEDRKTVVVEDE